MTLKCPTEFDPSTDSRLSWEKAAFFQVKQGEKSKTGLRSRGPTIIGT
jgi:hypothetical protein